MLQEIVRKENERVFLKEGLELKLLKNCPEAIPTLVTWVFEEWKSYDATLTKERLVQSFNKRLNDDKIPFSLVLLKNGKPIGTISLKFEEEESFKVFSKGNPWLGSLQIIFEERKKGLGDKLLTVIKTIGKSFGYTSIFLYTSNPLNVAWYTKKGAHLISTAPFRNHTVTIFEIPL